MNTADLIALALIFAALAGAIAYCLRNKKRGCGSSCENCDACK